MRIGTARPREDELRLVPHHFTGHISIHDEYNASRFESDALDLLGKLFLDHKVVILTGGSGLYINAVCHGIDDLPDPDTTLREELKHCMQRRELNPCDQNFVYWTLSIIMRPILPTPNGYSGRWKYASAQDGHILNCGKRNPRPVTSKLS